MIARIYIRLPFSLTIPEGETFTVWEYELDDCSVTVYPPVISSSSLPDGQEILIDDVKSIQADVLWIDFCREVFDRSVEAKCDPSYEVIGAAANNFIERLRYVTKAANVKPIDFPNVSWSLSYLNDNEEKLPVEEGLVRGRGARAFSFSWTPLNREVWDDIHKLEPDWKPPAWQTLLLDANASLPEVGPALVLAATALEVFIAQTLDVLAAEHEIPAEIWEWIKNRDWMKKPSIEEQFDFLLFQFGKKSLKSETALWESFKHLKNARNSFVHDGKPSIGNEVVDLGKARFLIGKAVEIIEYVKMAIPEHHRWPAFEHKFNLSLIQELVRQDESGT